MSIQFFFGNKIETLSTKLCEIISKEKPENIFQQSMIILPNLNLVKWLQMEIAKLNKICMNIEFKFLENGLTKALFDLIPKENADNYLFLGHKENHLELQLMILFSILESKQNELLTIKDYLGNPDAKDYPNRLWQLTDRLTKYFREYEYQREEMIKTWNKEKTFFPDSQMEKCQFELYKKNIF